jgi:hypothetical protein
MGMYDYLGGYQIKLFDIPLYYGEYYGLGFMGGQLRGYGKDEELPLQTLWYKYPKDFTILDEDAVEDYSDEYKEMVHIIKDSKYFDSVDLDKFEDKYIGDKVYDYRGSLLNIKSREDMYNHIKLKSEWKQKQNELEKSYFPEGVHECIRNNMDKYDKLEPQYHEELEKLNNEYGSKLYIKEEYRDEMMLGAYIDIAIESFNDSDKEKDEFKDYKKDYEEIKALARKFINSLEDGYIERYFEWLGDYYNDEHKNLIKQFIEKEIMEF